MFYLNLLITRKLAQLSLPYWGQDSTMDAEGLSHYGGRKLFMDQHFKENQFSADEIYERLEGDTDEMPLAYNRPWRHYFGTGYKQSPDGYMELQDSEGNLLRFSINENTKIQKHMFALDQIVHIYATVYGSDAIPQARVVVTEELNSLAIPFLSVSVRAQALKEIFDLKKQERTILMRFLADSQYSKKVFKAIAFLATCANDGQYLQDEYYIRNGMEQYNNEQDDKMFHVDTDELLTLMDIQDSKRILHLLEDTPEDVANRVNPWIDYLAVWSVIHKNTIWGDVSKVGVLLQRWNRCPGDLAACLARFCTDAELTALAVGFIQEISSQGRYADEAETLLFELLLVDSPLDDRTLHEIVTILFEKSINSTFLGAIGALLKGVHSQCIREYITEEFRRSFEAKENPKFTYLWTAIWTFDTVEQGENPLWLAEKYLLEQQNTQAALVGLSVLSLVAWSRRVGGGMPLRQFKMQKIIGLERVLYCYLSSPTVQFYKYTVNLCEDWILNGLLDQTILTKRGVVAACLTAMENPGYKEFAEKLLMLLPGSTAIADNASLRDEYLLKLEMSFKQKNTSEIMKFFRICRNLGCWTERDSLFAQFRRMVEVLSKYELSFDLPFEQQLHPDIYPLFRMTCAELMKLYEDQITETSATALEVFKTTLSEDDVFRNYRAIADDLRSNPDGVFELKDEKSVAEFIAITRQIEYKVADYKEQEELLRLLAERSRITVANMGSFLVVSWMKFILCRFDLGEKAVEFYVQNKNILDRPYLYYSTRAHHGFRNFELSDCHRFLKSSKRIVDALGCASDLGNTRVLTAFQKTAADGIIEVDIARKISTLSAAKRSPEYDDFYKKVRICGRLNVDFPKSEEFMGFEYYFDDLGLQNISFARCRTRAMRSMALDIV